MSASRRDFIKKAGLAIVSATMLPLYNNCSSKKRKPNIILILADDLGYNDLSCYGQKNYSTPNIDSLAKEGMKFSQHYAGSTVCAPSRCVLLTGKHTGHSYFRANSQMPLPPEEKTFAKELQENGYKTGCFGKWGLGLENTAGDPQKHGFDTFVGFYDQVLAHNSYPEYLHKNGKKIKLNNEVQYLPESHWSKGKGSYSIVKNDYAHDRIFDEVTKFVNENKDQPFFLYFPTTIPHENGEALENQRIEVPKIKQEFQNNNWSVEQKNYATMITLLDDYVGRLLQQVKDLGLENDTMVIFTSDNGACPFEWNILLECNGELRGYKRDLYEGGIRVPLIIKWPGKIQQNCESDHISTFWDYYPTMCEIGGVQTTNDKLDGISFLPTLLEKKQNKHEYLYWEYHFWEPSRQAVRFGKWKAIKNTPNSKIELYNLDLDINEKNNIADNHSDIVEKAKKILKSARVETELYPLKK